MKIVIAGGSGLIGQKLTDYLIRAGHKIIILTRKAKKNSGNVHYVQWLEEGTSPENEIRDSDVFINLAGVSINNGRWNTNHKKQIYNSRMAATDELLRIISLLPIKPSVLINASAIGIYPASINARYTEDSLETSNDFLGQTVYDWENKAKQVETYGTRTALMRLGVVLDMEGGALPLMVLPYRLFAGGKVGTGEQWVSWVHMVDVVRAIEFVITNSNLRGPVNVTAPIPVRMEYFGKTISSVLHRPHWLPVPTFVMRLILGRKSSLVLKGQHVVPKVLSENGFTFMFPTLHSALKDLLIK
ncbi:NAD dependent epimerase family protein [Neobacillus bataviensis LMG 21833]|uniref:NAD dependent epimerase family protein n=1 Tax=Neobacillus bataviensis LMG 21833 TaxID=1117379 RepID=K6CZU7_9BACI|nr:TIGR01777 family oxidoreductase [Neobacillus bataviensis]EKN65762.1 NAD dependent epimerase family protein [Neobacillus bataviensis LMG 21833]